MFPGHPERLNSYDYLGTHCYHIRFCTDRRQKIFTCASAYELALSQIQRAAARERFALLAYCFMPDHVHFVVQGLQDESDLRRFATAAKQLSGYAFSKANGGARLWQRYFYEHVLRSEETSRLVIRYVLANPVRAGLVVEPRNYPFLGSDVFSPEALFEFCDLRGA